MNAMKVNWLYSELPNLIHEGILPAETADRIREYYEARRKPGAQMRVAVILCGILGAALVGLGIILLLAHNWEGLARPIRAVLSFVPLVTGQFLAGWVIVRRKHSIAWREGRGVFLMAGVGAAISLISQTYNVSGDMASFLLTWMLLSLPIVYLLHASAPAIFYLAGITAWVVYVKHEGSYSVFFWLLAALCAPHLWLAARQERASHRVIVLSWAFSLCPLVATFTVLEESFPGLWIPVYAGIVGVYFLAGSIGRDDSPLPWHAPLRVLGGAGTAVLSFMFTFRHPWTEPGWHQERWGTTYHQWIAAQDCLLLTGLLAALLFLLVRRVRQKQWNEFLFGTFPLLAACGLAAVFTGVPMASVQIAFDVYLLALGIATLAKGMRLNRLLLVNAGMAMVSALVIARFFDRGLSFTIRGIAFIALGAAFLTANLVHLKLRAKRLGELS